MKNAREIYETSDKQLVGAYYLLLGTLGLQGQFAVRLLRAQRNQDRAARAEENPIYQYRDYRRLQKQRNEWGLAELVKFCIANQHTLKLTIRNYKYGIRVVIRRYAALRFRHLEGDRWGGDVANLDPILNFCDDLMFAAKFRHIPPAKADVTRSMEALIMSPGKPLFTREKEHRV